MFSVASTGRKMRLSVPLLIFFFFLLPCFAPALAGEAGEDAALVAAAKKEGKLSWYASMTVSEGDKLLRKFKEKYPFIETSYYRSGEENMMTRIMSETRAKKHMFDVVHIPVLNCETLKRRGVLAKYSSPHRQFAPEGTKDAEGYWTSIYLNLNVLGYNTKLVSPKEAPKSWDDLLAPRWKGKMGMDTKPFYWFGAMLKMQGEKKGLDYMKKLAEQHVQLRTGRTLNAQLVAAGEFSLGITLYNQRVEEMKTAGAPIEWLAIEPVIPDINPIAISAHAPHPHAAKLFVDYILSREGQEVIASFYRIPNRSDMDPIVPRLKKGLKVLPFDPTLVDDYERYIKLFREIFLIKK